MLNSSLWILSAFLVGRTINVAARLQGLTRSHGADILLTEDLRKTLEPRFVLRVLPPVELRGIAEPLSIYAVEHFAVGRR